MPATLSSLIAALRSDPGLRANVPSLQIERGIDAAVLLNTVLLDMIDETGANDDGRISPQDMQAISDALWRPANAQPWREFWLGHGNDNGDVETGYHYLQNDGGSLEFQGRNFADTVADAIYHYGFRIANGRYYNEDGNDNETIADVAGWLNFFLNGENIVYGTGGNDELGTGDYSAYFAAARSETFLAGAGNDSIWAGDGYDQVRGGDGNDRSGGGAGNDRMMGEAGADTLYGDDGADALYGGGGADVLGGGSGNDRMDGGMAGDELYGDTGNDSLYGGLDSDDLGGGAGADMIEGGDGNDSVSGGDGNDRLYGDMGADDLYAGSGADILRGGRGADEFFLWEDGRSRDTLFFGRGESGMTGTTIDRVEGFQSGTDRINLSAFGPMSFEELDFRGGGRASCYYSGRDGDGYGYLRIDADGNGATDMIVAFRWVDDLRAGDFIFA